MKSALLFRLFASAVAAAMPLATACGSIGGTPSCVDHPRTVPLSTDAGSSFLTTEAGVDGGLNCQALCAGNFCDLNPDGKTVTCHTECTGRRPQGLDASDVAPHRTLGDYFAEVAHLEAASIDAFRILAGELARFGAPERLVHAARRAKSDERRHVRLTGSLARRFGAAPRRPRVAPAPARALVDMAIENAEEGCVRETFGALVAHWQAAHAKDPAVKAAMARIARDETRHAALAWQTNAWMHSRLTPVERARVSEAMQRAAAEVSRTQTEPPRALRDEAGVPGSAVTARLASALEDRLWARGSVRSRRRGG